MLFNSIEFAIFLPIVFLLYWFVFQKNLKIQNAFLVLASYVFYGWWDWRFLSLIIISSLVDYCVGASLGTTDPPRKRKFLLFISLFVNLGLLGFLKYFNFFADSFVEAFTLFGGHFETSRLEIILPVGISFYTFQTLSYTISVYRRKHEPKRDIISFFAFVSFFPQLVAGPIERASNLLPQFHKKRSFDYERAVDGLRQILWGLFKKTVIADNCAEYANQIFNNSAGYPGSTLLLGAFFFAVQIYCDFSGYSDIAIGTSRLFGFQLMRNFAFPYFSRDIAEFWRRWHISLSTWFRDYVYIPLGGSRNGMASNIRNVFIIFVVSGFWHGANWTFVIWGALNALYFLPLLLLGKNRTYVDSVAKDRLLPTLKEMMQISTTFLLTILAWIFFRAENVTHALQYLSQIFSTSFFQVPAMISLKMIATLALVFVFFFMEWIQREKQHGLERLQDRMKRPLRWSTYVFLMCMILWLKGNTQDFIYFQF